MEQRKVKKGRWWKILLGIVIGIVALYLVVTLLNYIGSAVNMRYAKLIESVQVEGQIKPVIDTDGYYTFDTDRPLKIMHLTDVHLGGGILSVENDRLALKAIERMVRAERPDLIIITGDVTFPAPYVAGTNNNKRSTKLFIEFMENLGVYWTFTFGNHDQEIYSTLNADQISQIYASVPHPEDGGHCLFQNGREDINGNGNTMIKVRQKTENGIGIVTQVLVLLDSHSYTDSDPLGIKWQYENITTNQLDWYESEINRITAENQAIESTEGTVKSLAFWHIPVAEYLSAYNAYIDNQRATEGVNTELKYSYKYHFGYAWETGKIVFSGMDENDPTFERMYNLGSTQGIFCGHDHDNNFSITYDPNIDDDKDAIRLTYGYSIDYLAYFNIAKRGYQRGCVVITVNTDGTFDCVQNNLYTHYNYTDKGSNNLTPPTN
ncbi:MAG: metallophosphoesterase [Clostridia bacterium]|nr:metallophosphoesterase [Clostridia bacterium]